MWSVHIISEQSQAWFNTGLQCSASEPTISCPLQCGWSVQQVRRDVYLVMITACRPSFKSLQHVIMEDDCRTCSTGPPSPAVGWASAMGWPPPPLKEKMGWPRSRAVAKAGCSNQLCSDWSPSHQRGLRKAKSHEHWKCLEKQENNKTALWRQVG